MNRTTLGAAIAAAVGLLIAAGCMSESGDSLLTAVGTAGFDPATAKPGLHPIETETPTALKPESDLGGAAGGGIANDNGGDNTNDNGDDPGRDDGWGDPTNSNGDDDQFNDNGDDNTNDNGGDNTNDNGDDNTNENADRDEDEMDPSNSNDDDDQFNDNGDDDNDNGAGNSNDNGTGNTNDNGTGNTNDNGTGNTNDNGSGNTNDNGTGNTNDNGGGGGLCPDGSFRVRAPLGAGRAEYRLLPGGCERFRVRINGGLSQGTYGVTVAGVVVGTIAVDNRGRGELELDSTAGTLPPGFPDVMLNDVVQVGGLSGTFGLDCSADPDTCNGNGNGNSNTNTNGAP